MAVQVEACLSFYHGEKRSRFSRFYVNESTANKMAKRGLVKILGNVQTAMLVKKASLSSALPPAPVSPVKTSKKSKSGAKAKAAAE